MITGGSITTGLNDIYNKRLPSETPDKLEQRVFPAQVIKVCMSSNDTDIYKFPRDIGAIKYRTLVGNDNRNENEVETLAYPLDRSIMRYPLPGEEVLIVRAYGDSSGVKDKVTMVPMSFYIFSFSAAHNVTSNSHPFIKSEQKSKIKSLASSKDEASLRFDKKTVDINSYKTIDNKIKAYKQLQPYEGDFILQGRFGNSIRFGSTSPKTKTPWADQPTSPGVSGDGIMVLRVDRDYTTKSEDMFVKEDVDRDDSTIMLCTSQKVIMNLNCSTEMKSWQARYNIKGSSKADGVSNITKAKDTSQLWQKPISTAQPANNQYKIT